MERSWTGPARRKIMIINREWANPNKWTFTIKPIKELLNRYVGTGKNWVDPYSGKHSPAELTNDLDPKMPSKYHLDAKEFCLRLKGMYKGVILDPPYSYRQVKEHYKRAGIKLNRLDTTTNFYNRVMNAICDKIEIGGYAITCGWNSNGFGKKRGFKIIEILLVAHGGHRYDTIVVVEKKI